MQLLNELDRLFGTIMAGVPSKKHMVKTSEIEALQDQLEDLNLKVLDQQEANSNLSTQLESWKRRQAETQDLLRLRSADTARCTSLEAELKTLKEAHTTLRSNFDHVFKMQQSKEAMLKESLRLVEGLRTAANKSDEYKVQAEHLARKSITLLEDHKALEKNYTILMGSFNDVNARVEALTTENNQFKEQTTRLLQEKSKYECVGVANNEIEPCCGVCLTCQLQQTQGILNQTALNLERCLREKQEIEHQLKDNANLLVVAEQRHTEKNKIIQDLIAELKLTKDLKNLLIERLKKITQVGIFKRKKLAEEALNLIVK